MPVRTGALPRQNIAKDDRHGRDIYPLRDSSLLPSSFLKSSRPEHSRMRRYLSRRTQRLLFALISLASLTVLYLLFASSSHSPKEIIREVHEISSQATNVRLGGAKQHGAVGHPHVAARATVTLTQTHTIFVTERPLATSSAVSKEITMPVEPVVFVLIMISADSASEGAILLKVRMAYSARRDIY